MNAYDSARLDDLRQREQVRGETLTPTERMTLARLEAQEREEYENQPRPNWFGGDYPDL